MQLSQKHATFSQFISAFFKSRLNEEHFQRKEDFMADVFPKLQTPKSVLKKTSKKSPFWGSFDKQYAKATKYCWNLHGATFTIYIDHCENKWVGKNLS